MTVVREEAVVCVHGLWLSGFAMRYWRIQFERAGFAAPAFSYPSVRGRMANNRAALVRFVETLPQKKVHFAGHSLGAVTIVATLDSVGWTLQGKQLGRVVLAGQPRRPRLGGWTQRAPAARQAWRRAGRARLARLAGRPAACGAGRR